MTAAVVTVRPERGRPTRRESTCESSTRRMKPPGEPSGRTARETIRRDGTGASPALRERTRGTIRRVCMRCTRCTAIVYGLGFFDLSARSIACNLGGLGRSPRGADTGKVTHAQWLRPTVPGRRSRPGARCTRVRHRVCASLGLALRVRWARAMTRSIQPVWSAQTGIPLHSRRPRVRTQRHCSRPDAHCTRACRCACAGPGR